jgi:hypothetical protein
LRGLDRNLWQLPTITLGGPTLKVAEIVIAIATRVSVKQLDQLALKVTVPRIGNASGILSRHGPQFFQVFEPGRLPALITAMPLGFLRQHRNPVGFATFEQAIGQCGNVRACHTIQQRDGLEEPGFKSHT